MEQWNLANYHDVGVFTGWPDIWRITVKNVVHLQAEYKLRTAYNTLHVVMTGFRKTLYR